MVVVAHAKNRAAHVGAVRRGQAGLFQRRSDRGTSVGHECLRPVRGKALGVLRVESVAERVAHHFVL